MLRTVAQYTVKREVPEGLNVVWSRRTARSLVFAKREMLAVCVDQFLVKSDSKNAQVVGERFAKGQHSEGRQLCGLKLMFIIFVFTGYQGFTIGYYGDIMRLQMLFQS